MKRLKKIRLLCTAALFMGIVLAACGHMVAGIAMLAGAFVLEYRFFRCPGCHSRLDNRFRMVSGSRCPHCGMEVR